MAIFRVRRTDYGATLKDPTISTGFLVRDTSTDPTFTVSTPVTTDDTQVKVMSAGDGKISLVS
jgi:hypothetical protein